MHTLVIHLATEPPDSLWLDAQGSPMTAPELLRQPPHKRPQQVIALVPGEQVSTFSVELPKKQRQRALEAARYAVEDLIASDIDAVHVAVGDIDGDGRVGCAVVALPLLERWADQCRELGLTADRMLPDYLALARSDGRAAALRIGSRVLARFATDQGMVGELDWFDTVLDGRAIDRPRAGRLLAAKPVFDSSIDLAQGLPRHRQAGQAPQRWRLPAGLAACCALVYGATAIESQAELQRELAELRRQAETLARRVIVDGPIVDPFAQVAGLARSSGTATDALGALQVLAEARSRLPSISVNELSYRDGVLEATLVASDLSTLEAMLTQVDQPPFRGQWKRLQAGAGTQEGVLQLRRDG